MNSSAAGITHLRINESKRIIITRPVGWSDRIDEFACAFDPPFGVFHANCDSAQGNQIAAMQCLQLYLKDSARAWLRGLPKGSIKSWDDLVDAFVANFQATYKRPVGIEELRNCQQKQRESMRSYIGRFTKLLNAAEDVSVTEQSTLSAMASDVKAT
ncbi:hypothetical protein QYE76_011406 [Lolium multiflorum]|uniref:Retrotransposon gag domain-containing protein n=1 Tax=Lolium multiflorum TaxID=4521 RepID=A0AAD8TZF3_LOLMU|nr:hypothetical protein QYE76_011406 [Lolium multiflorum]